MSLDIERLRLNGGRHFSTFEIASAQIGSGRIAADKARAGTGADPVGRIGQREAQSTCLPDTLCAMTRDAIRKPKRAIVAAVQKPVSQQCAELLLPEKT
jgi:hypothetical protein